MPTICVERHDRMPASMMRRRSIPNQTLLQPRTRTSTASHAERRNYEPQMHGRQSLHLTRRHFFGRSATGVGIAALASLLNGGGRRERGSAAIGGLPGLHFAPKAKRVIYLFQSGAPSQMDLFDYKPKLAGSAGKELPDSIRHGQRLTGMTAGAEAASRSRRRCSSSPSMAKAARGSANCCRTRRASPTTCASSSRCTPRRSITTRRSRSFRPARNWPGRPSMGAWLSYGLGSENRGPAGVRGDGLARQRQPEGQPLYDRLWGSGFLPTQVPGRQVPLGTAIRCCICRIRRASTADVRRRMLDDLAAAQSAQARRTRRSGDRHAHRAVRDGLSHADLGARADRHLRRTAARLRTVRPRGEQAGHVRRQLPAGPAAGRTRRAVRPVVPSRLGPAHGDLPQADQPASASDTDQPSAALITDLKQRGLLDDTLVVWGGEFGRTVYCQGKLTADNYGRDHHPRCFTIWMAGGGIKPGMTYGETDDFCYNIAENPVHVHDLHATMLHCLGIDHDAADLQVPRPLLPPDRRARQRRSRDPGVRRASSAAARLAAANATKNKRQFAISWLATDVWGEDGRRFFIGSCCRQPLRWVTLETLVKHGPGGD